MSVLIPPLYIKPRMKVAVAVLSEGRSGEAMILVNKESNHLPSGEFMD